MPKRRSRHAERIRRVAENACRFGAALTERQMDVLRLYIRGKSSKQMATALGLNERTIADHRQKIIVKSGTESMQEAVCFYCQIMVRPEWAGTLDLRDLGMSGPSSGAPPDQTSQTWTNGVAHHKAASRHAKRRRRDEQGRFVIDADDVV